LFDDVFATRLPGNPYSDPYIDLAEQVSTDGFTISGLYEPDVINTALDQDHYIYDASRRTHDTSNHIGLKYDGANAQFEFVLGSSGTGLATLAHTFSALDAVRWRTEATSTGGMGLYVGVASSTETFASASGSTAIPAGITRMWLRNGNDYSQPPRGTVSMVAVENSTQTAEQTANWFDVMDATDADRLAFLTETHGRIYHIAPAGFEILTQELTDRFLCSLTLEEVDTVGSISVSDA
jgi:hypothetical protein